MFEYSGTGNIRSIRSRSTPLSASDYENAVCNKFWRARGDIDAAFAKIFTVYPRNIPDEILSDS